MYNQTNTAGGAERCGPANERFSRHGFGYGRGYRRPKYNVPVNIADNDTNFEVHVYALGFAKENIKISVNNDVLYISGTRQVEEASIPNFTSQEYPVKSFERMISLNDTVDKTGITARQEEGVLILTLPKTKEAQTPAQEIKVD